MVVVVAGKFSPLKVKKLAKVYFGGFEKQKSIAKKKLKISQTRPQLRVVYKKTDQTHFCLGVHGVPYSHPDRFVVSIIASILGFSRTSRIYRRIREERGWAYYVHTMPEYYTDAGALYTRAGVSLDKIDDSIKLVQNEYQHISEKKVSGRELKKAKEYLKGRFILGLEDSFSVASRYAIQTVVEKEIRTPDQVLALIDKVTAEDVFRVSRRLFKAKKLNLALIGPYKKSQKFKKLLN
jgi:predicted Zn-dependent peptidase